MNLPYIIITETLIFLGAITMGLAIFQTRKILRKVKRVRLRRNWKALVFLMLFFLMTYMVSVYFVYKPGGNILLLLTGVVFFFGSVFVYGVVYLGYQTLSGLENAVEELETTSRNLSTQNENFLELAKKLNPRQNSFEKVIREITELGSQILNVERVSVWRFNDKKTAITAIDLFEAAEKKHSEGATLHARDYPEYFKALEENRAIPANDALTDPRTSEFSKSYLVPLGIHSMLDVAISTSDKQEGIICFEQVGRSRIWKPEDLLFASTLAYFVSLAIETSEREKSEIKLRKSEERFKRLSESSFEGIVIHEHGKIVEANSAFSKIFGYNHSSVAGLRLSDLIAPESKDMLEAGSGKEIPDPLEVRAIKKDGQSILVEIMEKPMDSNDQALRIMALRDVTWKRKSEEEKSDLISELKKTQENLETKVNQRTLSLSEANLKLTREIEKRKEADEQIKVFSDIVENIPIGLLIFQFENIEDTKSLKAIMANPAAESMGNAKANDFIGKYLYEFSPDTFESGRDKIYQEVVKTGKPKDLGTIRYKGTKPNESAGTQIPENYFNFVAFPLPNNSVAICMENVTERVKTEERFQRVVEASPSAFIMLNNSGRIILVNTRAETLYGYSREELQNMNYVELVPERFRNEFVSGCEEFFRNPEDFSKFSGREQVILTKNNTEITVEKSFSPIYTKSGVYLLASVVDITERKKAQEQIQVYEDTVKNIPIGLDIMRFEDPEDITSLKVIVTNPAFDELTGIKGKDVIGKRAIDFVPEIFSNGKDKEFMKVIKTESPKDLGTIHHKGNGQVENYIHMRAFPIPHNYIALSYEDITEQIKMEERFRLIVEASPAPLIMIDKLGKINLVNSQATELFGYSKAEFKDMQVDSLFPEHLRKNYFENRVNIFENPGDRTGTRRLEQTISLKDGTSMPVDIAYNPIYTKGETYLLASISNVSERKMTEEMVETEKRAFTALAENVPVIITRMNREAEVEFMNSMGKEKFKIKNNEITSFSELFANESTGIIKEKLAEVFSSGKQVDFEIKGQREDGNLDWYTNRIVPVLIEDKIRCFIAISMDTGKKAKS